MNPIVRNILAVIGGLAVGSAVNMGIIMLASSIIPPPEGVDVMDPESIKNLMHLFEPKHFIGPFLAHALGTLAGAFLAARIATSNKMNYALGIGLFFLIGGIVNVNILPAPTWFAVLDLLGAYFPAAWLGGTWAMSKKELS